MCKYCNPELMDDGDNERLIDNEEFDMGILGKCRLDVDVFIPENKPPELSIWLEVPHSSRYWDQEGRNIDTKVLIHYCPMCGRKLSD